MTCEEMLNLICARLDRELPAEDVVRLDAHLATCATCRATADAMAAQDVDLRAAFAGRRVAAEGIASRVIAQLPLAARVSDRPSAWRIPWLPMILSAAAGFAVAFGLFHREPKSNDITRVIQPGTQSSTNPSGTPIAPATRPAIAQLALATGAVEYCCPGESKWSPMATGGSIEAGTKVRTGPGVRCELRTSDGSEIRLNAGTEVALKSPRRFELAGGQMWSSVAHDPQPFEAVAANTVFTALGTQFDLEAKPLETVCTVAEGSVRVSNDRNQDVLSAGQQMTVAQGRLGGKREIDSLALATRWVNEILVMKGRDNPELAKRIDDMFARIGQEKMSFLYEEEIRGLGDHCVIPLTRYIQSDRSNNAPTKRALAAKIVSDVAPSWAIPELIELLRDTNGEVRSYAASGLRRLTGKEMDRSPEQWRRDNVMACEPSINSWEQWWKRNRERYPGVPPMEPQKEQRKAQQKQPLLQKG